MRNPLRTLITVAAMAAATLFALPPDANAHHRFRYGFGHGFGHGSAHGLYRPGLYTHSGSVRIELESEWRDAEVYVDGAHVGNVDDFDGFFQRLRLPTGEHEIQIRLDEDRAFGRRILVSRGRTYKLRERVEPIAGACES